VIERQIASLLCMEIDFLLRVEQQKKDLESLPNFNLRHCFKAIDESHNKFIDVLAIRRFFIKVGHKPVKEELSNIMRRVDLDGDCKISFYEF
jgi:Ca2+-binding EF-hand superfamily protein